MAAFKPGVERLAVLLLEASELLKLRLWYHYSPLEGQRGAGVRMGALASPALDMPNGLLTFRDREAQLRIRVEHDCPQVALLHIRLEAIGVRVSRKRLRNALRLIHNAGEQLYPYTEAHERAASLHRRKQRDRERLLAQIAREDNERAMQRG